MAILRELRYIFKPTPYVKLILVLFILNLGIFIRYKILANRFQKKLHYNLISES